MGVFSRILLGVFVVLIPSFALAQQSPDAVVREIYSTYSDNGLGVAPTDAELRELFSARLQPLLAEEDQRIRRNGLGLIDFDVFVDAQVFDVTDLNISAPKFDGTTATVDVTMRNFGEPRRLRFGFVRENDAWRIDEIAALSADLPWQLTALLRPN